MKLNYKRIILVGFAFFLIQAFWQAYDNTIPMILTNKFGMSQAWSGAIMALDNVLALFMLPLIPNHLRQRAKLEKEVVVAGIFNRVEIWNARTGKRPLTRSENFSMTWPFSLISDTTMPLSTPQSSSRMMTSWHTSTMRRVR